MAVGGAAPVEVEVGIGACDGSAAVVVDVATGTAVEDGKGTISVAGSVGRAAFGEVVGTRSRAIGEAGVGLNVIAPEVPADPRVTRKTTITAVVHNDRTQNAANAKNLTGMRSIS